MSNSVNARVRPGRAPKPMPSLVTDELCLNFLNSLNGRDTAFESDFLAGGEDVVDFMRHAGAIDLPTAEALHAQLGERKGAYTRLYKRAIEIREILAALFFCLRHGQAPAAEDVAALDGHWKEFTADGALVHGADGFQRAWRLQTAPAAFLLGPVIRSFFDLAAAGDWRRMKACPAEDCHFTFYDHSKNNSRVWCQMATCGNRAKVRRFTRRRKRRAG